MSWKRRSVNFSISIAARSSPLSRAQFEEVTAELALHHPQVQLQPIWVETTGDKDQKTSLRTLDKTDFFTREIDALQLTGKTRLSVHSAKDLPDPLPEGLSIAALTQGVDPSDVLVLREHDTVQTLPPGAKIGTSSERREKNITELRSDLQCVDIRGNISQRLSLLDQRVVDGVVMAEAALIRLKLTHRNRISLPGERAALQGQLAILALNHDEEMHQLFKCMDTRRST